jgi:hypothetical protein
MTIELSRAQQKRRTALEGMNRLAWLLDNSIPIPLLNYRIGLDPLIGLIPGLGDVAGLLLSSFIVIQALRLGAPKRVLLNMVVNIGIEALVGVVPVVGDLFDATFKANARNVRLLTQFLDPKTIDAMPSAAPSRGAIALIIGLLVGLLVLISGIAAVIWWGVQALLT